MRHHIGRTYNETEQIGPTHIPCKNPTEKVNATFQSELNIDFLISHLNLLWNASSDLRCRARFRHYGHDGNGTQYYIEFANSGNIESIQRNEKPENGGGLHVSHKIHFLSPLYLWLYRGTEDDLIFF